MTLPFMDKVFRAQLEYPDAGRFRIHGILEQEMGEDTPSESTLGRARSEAEREGPVGYAHGLGSAPTMQGEV